MCLGLSELFDMKLKLFRKQMENTLLEVSREIELEVNREKTKYIVVSRH
jgi:hypothetical protein